jgi:DNA-directed DNA polymerase III PolC
MKKPPVPRAPAKFYDSGLPEDKADRRDYPSVRKGPRTPVHPADLRAAEAGEKGPISGPAHPRPPQWAQDFVDSVRNTNGKALQPSPRLRLGAGGETPALSQDLQYVELLGRSNFSFLQGASHPEEMVTYAQGLGYRGMALCDLNGLYGVVRAFQAIEYPSNFIAQSDDLNRDFKFYCGAEMQLSDGSSVALLPIHKDGYTNLCQIITESKRGSQKTFSNLDLDILQRYNDDLIALALPPWKDDQLLKLREIFEDRLYLPVWKDYTWDSLQLYNQALQLEARYGFELFATQRPFMAEAKKKVLHDVLTCILHKTTLKKAKTRLLTNGERHLKTLPELAKLWTERPDLLQKTMTIANRIQFTLKELHYEYPHAARPPGIEAPEYLRELTEKGLKIRFPQGETPKIRKMVEHELKLIGELRYEDYFLTLWDVCQFAKGRGILHQGRGSAANSIVCYCLGLTAVNPTQVELLFERFISKERGEPPDIDIDFESGRREEIIQYIYEKYGASHAAMVCTVICYRSRMAMREIAKVLEIPLESVELMIKFMGREGLKRLKDVPEKAQDWKIAPQTYELLLRMTMLLISFPRHLGIHTGGFLIAKRPITECVPVEKATMDKRYVIQWNKDDLTVLKMLKIDVLGLGMLTALNKCFEMLKEHKGIELDLYDVPQDDKATYDMICRADTVGTFQVESRAQMSLLPRLKPRIFYDLVIEVAIVRPGPIQGGMIHPFIRRRDGLEPVTYPHPDLEPILKKTCGVPIFQEQIMQIASTVAGFTPGEADELRRIMSSSWKKHDLMEGLRQRLISGMINHGIKIEYAEQIYQTIIGFASYGFPESHAASFAIITYVSCFLKEHHPEVFVASLLNAQPMGFYSPRALIMDAQRHQVKFCPVDVQMSDYDYTLEDGAVRVGFRALYGLKEKHIQALIQERKTNGKFHDLMDLVRRTSLNKSTLMCLAAAGAFNSLGVTPREALWKVQSVNVNPASLFFGTSSQDGDEYLPRENNWQTLQREYGSQGYSLVHHPLSILRPALERWSRWQRERKSAGFTKASQMLDLKNNQYVRVAGLLSLQQRPPTAKGFAFLTLEDETGVFNIILMPKVYEEFRLVVIHHPLLHVYGKLQKVARVIHIKAEIIRPLPSEKLLQVTPAELDSGFDLSKCFDDHTIG